MEEVSFGTLVPLSYRWTGEGLFKQPTQEEIELREAEEYLDKFLRGEVK